MFHELVFSSVGLEVKRGLQIALPLNRVLSGVCCYVLRRLLNADQLRSSQCVKLGSVRLVESIVGTLKMMTFSIKHLYKK